MLSPVVPDTVELSETGAADEKVDCCKRVVDGCDDERVSDPDHTCCGQSHVLGDRDLVSGSREILETGGNETPLH